MLDADANVLHDWQSSCFQISEASANQIMQVIANPSLKLFRVLLVCYHADGAFARLKAV